MITRRFNIHSRDIYRDVLSTADLRSVSRLRLSTSIEISPGNFFEIQTRNFPVFEFQALAIKFD